ncbi:MAG TPA: hypothetical protein VII49_01235 [Rhizomicrobium sp.]
MSDRVSLGIRASIALAGLVLAAGVSCAPALAAVKVSADATRNMTCSGGICSPTASDAVLNTGDLEALLAAGDVTVTTIGSGVQANTLDVAAAFAWSASNTLTLDALRSIVIRATISDGGTGGMILTANNGGKTGKLDFAGGNITFANTASPLTINGKSYALESSIAQLAAAIAAKPRGRYALANPYDASGDGTYAHPPIPTTFLGTFEGLGNAISNFSITDTTDELVGLFAELGERGTIRDIGLPQASINVSNSTTQVARAGALAGVSVGNIEAASASGTNIGTGRTYGFQGGLVGENAGTIVDSFSTAKIQSNGAGGGLVGVNDATIRDSHAAGDVTSGSPNIRELGGLVGDNNLNGFIEHSYATGAVTEKVNNDDSFYETPIGGFAGENDGWIDASNASGAVIAEIKSKSTGADAGGFAGLNTGAITLSFATGAVGAGGTSSFVGGMVGGNESTVVDCYASGAATGGSDASAGGLIGNQVNDQQYSGTTASSYSTGIPSAKIGGQGSHVGGSMGQDQSSDGTMDSYWDTTTSGKTRGTGNRGNEPGLKGLSTTQLQAGLPSGFDTAVWAENPDINGGKPYLIANPPT